MSRVIIHRRAAKYVRKLPNPQKDRVKTLLKQLQHKPLMQPQVRQMAGDWAGYDRIRLSNIRIIFWYDNESDTVYVDYIGARGDIYKSGG
jgi:mRNA interferase RelE/StbE